MPCSAGVGVGERGMEGSSAWGVVRILVGDWGEEVGIP